MNHYLFFSLALALYLAVGYVYGYKGKSYFPVSFFLLCYFSQDSFPFLIQQQLHLDGVALVISFVIAVWGVSLLIEKFAKMDGQFLLSWMRGFFKYAAMAFVLTHIAAYIPTLPMINVILSIKQITLFIAITAAGAASIVYVLELLRRLCAVKQAED